MTKQLSKKQIEKMIRKTKAEIMAFEKNIKNAPPEIRGEFKIWVRQCKNRLRKLESQNI